MGEERKVGFEYIVGLGTLVASILLGLQLAWTESGFHLWRLKYEHLLFIIIILE
jgi:hypothetical protein